MFRFAHRGLLVALLLVPSVAAAQDPGDVGVFMGYPSLGFVWQLSEKVAIRPEISFATSTSDFDTDNPLGVSSSSDAWSIEFGASALLYLNDDDRLRTYVAPRFAYAHSDASSSSVLGESAGSSYEFAGLFGGQYSLNDRFSVFGEVGVGYAHATSEFELSGAKTTRDSWGPRTGVGVILSF